MSERGLVIVYTGEGKGKTSAALGNVLRALGHGWRVLVIQFFKGDWPVTFGELESAKAHPNLEMLQLGRGFVGIMGDKKPRAEHEAAARGALATAKEKILSDRYDLVVLDEINCAVSEAGGSLLTVESVLDLLARRPARTNLILTGRGADERLVEAADLVTEMREVKHPFRKGVPARKGIDF
ncbi:MAG TPA: cob(I)yrinic acid a,c-diamide adenosyltransferase [Candidatus Eisenbacteria bacterium]|nr:cob(I)yrinic acid a,c-diamide adenosyltransferase [Candidatus Eisenbacteria bacterium]